MRKGKIIVTGVAAMLALVAMSSPHHRASIEIFAHRQGDIAPQRVQAVVDLGVVAVSVLVTWSKRLTY